MLHHTTYVLPLPYFQVVLLFIRLRLSLSSLHRACACLLQDVIGVVVSVLNTASIQGSNQSSPTTKRLVVIKDARNCGVTLTLWGQRAKDFDAEYVYEKGQKNYIPILFVGILMKRYGQNKGLLGGAACRWYISPNIPEATAITSSFPTSFQPVSRTVLHDQTRTAQITLKQYEDKTLKDILDINPFDFPRDGNAL